MLLEPSQETIAMAQPLRRKLEVFLDLEDREKDCIARMATRDIHCARGDTIIDAGEAQRYIYILQKGWTMTARTLADGRRQVTRFAIPGDFLCFDAGIIQVSSTSVTALTDVHAYRLQFEELIKVFAEHPRLGMAFSWCNAQDESILAERLTSVGRRSAYERLAHLFIELWHRLKLLDLTEDDRFLLPVSRVQLADAVGLTSLHIYRTLRKLQQNNLIRLLPKGIKILDMDGLHEAALFEETYLHYTELPRHTERSLKKLAAAAESNRAALPQPS